MRNKKIPALNNIWLIILLLLFPAVNTPLARTMKIIHGYVTDAETGNFLPGAHIYVNGTRTGIITNDNGYYNLKLETQPSTILVSYIGYKRRKITITENSPEEQNVALTPVPIVLEEIVVTSVDPAVRIMKEVIRRKQIWQASLETYKADAYTRVLLENDKSIVSISESISDVLWERGKGPREVVKAKRQTSNIGQEENFASARSIPNFYDDDIDIVGYKVIGPTNPDALKYYDFKLTGIRKIDDTKVYDISVNPKSKLQPLFIGVISVLDGEYALIEVDLKPGDSLLFPMPIEDLKLSYKQQFSNFGSEYWLPVDLRNEGEIKIKLPGLTFPAIKYRQMTRLTDYKVNIVLSDSLLEKEKRKGEMTVSVSDDSVTMSVKEGDNASRDESEKSISDSLFAAQEGMIIPLTDAEEEAYSTIDSTMTLMKAFKPTGFLARFIKEDAQKKRENKNGHQSAVSRVLSGVSPQIWHNRVDAFRLGLKYKKRIKNNITYELRGAFSTGLKRWAYGGELRYNWGKSNRWSTALNAKNDTDLRYRSGNYPIYFNSFQTLSGRNDYFDYFRNKKLRADIGYRFIKFRTDISAGINIEHHTSLEKTTDNSIFGSDKEQRVNPAIDKGRLRSAELSVVYGGEKVPLGIIGKNRAELIVEHSSPDFLSSNFLFTTYRFTIDWRINTFLRRRLLPNTLDLRIIGGTYSGDIPVQRFGIIDGTIAGFSPFGVFRTLRDKPLEGEQYFALFWEHNFRTVPFELVGLRRFAKKGMGIILHGAAGSTWISEKRLAELSYNPLYRDGFESEIGLSLNALFGYFRLDITKRLNSRGVYIGYSAARMF